MTVESGSIRFMSTWELDQRSRELANSGDPLDKLRHLGIQCLLVRRIRDLLGPDRTREIRTELVGAAAKIREDMKAKQT